MADGQRLALVTTGGSGALASVVGVARALEEGGVRPAVISLCSGSALFGFPIAAGLYVASQMRTCQQIELARENLARLRSASTVTMIEPVPYEKVRGVGFYRQFMSTRDWASFMTAGYVTVGGH